MIDIHTHILPGLDDGSDTLEDSLEMARIAEADGIGYIFATTHSNLDPSRGIEHRDNVLARTRELRRALISEDIRVQVFPGMEIMASEDIAQLMREHVLIGLNDSHYYLMEYPFNAGPDYMDFVIDEMLGVEGAVPVIAHPERYFYIQAHPEHVYGWVMKGCLPQINRASLEGKFGPAAQEACIELMDHNLVAFLASDAHTPRYRTPRLSSARAFLSERYSEYYAKLILEDNPRHLIDGRPLDIRAAARRI
ncbi:MAG: hypothetical protein K5637_08050 [Lachnospiraceae bacterium]|nr:hypothetical protein [Lachnospiraceae bacterium]